MRPGPHPSRRRFAAPQSLTEKATRVFKGLSNRLKVNQFSSWPGLSRLRGQSRFGVAKARPSTSFLLDGKKDVDARHKAGHDELNESARFHWLHFESDSHDEGIKPLVTQQ